MRLHAAPWVDPTGAQVPGTVLVGPAHCVPNAHSLVANSLALHAKGVTAATPSPQGGTVVVDPETGELTGLLRERAQYLVKSREAGMPAEALAEAILAELQTCAARGVTTVHDIVINRDEIRAYQLLERSGRLPGQRSRTTLNALTRRRMRKAAFGASSIGDRRPLLSVAGKPWS